MRNSPSSLVRKSKEVASDVAAAKSASEVSYLKKKRKEALSAASESEARLQFMCAMRNRGRSVQHRIGTQARSKSDFGVAAIIPLTDIHAGEHIESKAVNGKNFYNIQECEKRLDRYYNKVVELVDWHSSLARITELWHPMLGDLLTGNIHAELMETNDLSPVETCVFLRDKICSGIDFLLKKTRLPIYIPTCVGNHGRTTDKPRIKTSCRNSFEWLLYKTLEKSYEKNPRVQFFVGEGYHNIQTIVGRKVRFHHGDGLKYNGGVGGIAIPVNKAIAQWDKVESVDFDIFGHWHQFKWDYTKWVACGTAMGYSEFSLFIKADFQHPTQTFVVVDKRYGITHAEPIFLTSPKRG
jgi:hypothetical protein